MHIVNTDLATPRGGVLRQWSRDWGGLFTISLGVYTLLILLWLVFEWGGEEYKTLINDTATPVAKLGLVILAWRAATHAALDARTRRAWKILTLAATSYFIGDVLWFHYEIIQKVEPATSWADVPYLLFYPLLLWSALTFPAEARTKRARTTFWLDAATVMVGAGMAVWYFILRPVAGAEHNSALDAFIALAYPVGDLVTLFGVTVLTLRKPEEITRRALKFLMAALTINTVADLGYGYATLQEGYVSGNWPDGGWAIAFFLMALSAHYQYWCATRARRAETAAPADAPAISLLPYLAIALGYGLLLAITFKNWQDLSATPLNGLIIGAVALTALVVARQVAAVRENARLLEERAARQSELRFRSLVQNSSDVITILDADATIRYESSSSERVLGYTPDEMIGKKLTEVVHPEDAAGALAYFHEAVSRPGVRAPFEWRLRHKNGSWLHVENIGNNLFDDENVRGLVINARDITERKLAEERLKAEEQLKAYAAQLQRSNRDLDDFASVASHDLQEPLRKVQAFGDRLKSKYGQVLLADGCDYLERMQSAAHRMQTLITDLLAFSRVTAKTQPFAPVDLAEVTRGVLSDLEVRIQQTGASVEAEGLPTIDADPTQMRQLLQNLIGNALKFRRAEQEPFVRIRGRLVAAAGHAHKGDAPEKLCEIVVEDNGIGFDEKHLDRIFTVFQRLHGRSAYEGSGVGLAVCRKIAERHDGTITARSAPGEGATFVVTLPAKQVGPDGGLN